MSRSPSPVVRRATRTYGRRRNVSECDTSFDAANTSIESREDSHSSTSLPLDNELPPSSDDFDASNTSPLSAHAADANASDDQDDEPKKGLKHFEFPWQVALKQMDDDDYEFLPKSDARRPLAELSEGDAAVPTRPASPLNQAAKDAFSGTRASLTSPSRSSSFVIHTRAPRRVGPLPPSESESEAAARPSTPQTSPRNPINTPQTRSSPTPPTSIEMPPQKGKGKRRDVNPLLLESDDHSALSSKPSKPKQRKAKASDTAKRVKAPTRKERIETQKTTARIVAEQPVSIPRVQQHKFHLTDFLGRLKPPPHAAEKSQSRSRSRTPPIPSTSDPIQAFSSSPGGELHTQQRHASSSKSIPREDEFRPTGLLDPEAASSDDDMPDVSEMLEKQRKQREEEQRKQEEEERLQRLREVKMRALEQQQARQADDSDDELEIRYDMKSVAREEAQTRRGLAAQGMRPSRRRSKQLALMGAGARRESAAFQVRDEQELRHVLESAAVSSFQAPKTKETDKPRQLGADILGKILLAQDNKLKAKINKEKEADWVRRGGRLKEHPAVRGAPTDAQATLREIMEKQRAAASRTDDVEMANDSDSDEDYQPDDGARRDGSGASDGEDDENAAPSPVREDPSEQADDEGDDDNPFVAPRPRRSVAPARHRPIAAIVSDDEEDSENRPPPLGRVLVRDSSAHPTQSPQPPGELDVDSMDHSLARRGSTSSLGDRTEDGTDKENDARLSFDRGEDKENTVIAVQSPALSFRMSRGLSGLFAAESQASPAGRSATDGVRSPLRELPADDEDEDDPFAFSPGPLRLSGPAPAAVIESPSLDLSGGSGLEPAFSLSRKGKERAHSPSLTPLAEALPIEGGRGFSQFFTQEGSGGDFDKLKAAQGDDDIALTLDTGLQPALEVDQNLAKKADELFEREQELALQEQQETRVEPQREMFVDENGFLTQTRPEFRSPLALMTPSQPGPGLHLSSPGSLLSSGARRPLASLLSQVPEDDDAGSKRRLRKRDLSPSPERLQLGTSKPKNAFDILGRRVRSPKPKSKKAMRSEFIEGEAEESDEDARYGFGGRAKDDDDEEDDDEDQDQIMPELVDDQEMDAKTLAEQAVLEKHREQLEQDDKLNEKRQMEVVTGQHRVRRRDRGVGIDGSDSESDGDGGRVKVKPSKRRRINDNIDALAKNPETQAFAEAYKAPLEDTEDSEFASLEQDQMDLDVQEEPESGKEPERVTAAQLREQLQEAARQNHFAEKFDPHDISWALDDEDSDDAGGDVRVREVEADRDSRRMPPPGTPEKAKGDHLDKTDEERMARWAKSEGASRTAGIVGRSTGGSAAVTGHGKGKAGNGSFKGSRPPAPSVDDRKSSTKVRKMPSALSAVSSRRSKFAS